MRPGVGHRGRRAVDRGAAAGASPAVAAALNEGEGGLTQLGKFITVYPDGADQAVRLASALGAATHGLRGPRPPGDRAFASGGIVSYRYEGAGEPAEDPFVAAGA